MRASLTLTSRHSFLVDSVRFHVDSAVHEPLLREAITLQGPRAWRRFSRVIEHVFVVPAETAYHSAGKFGLLNEATAVDGVRAAVSLFELGLLGWHCLVAGLDQTEAHAELSDRLTFRASRRFCLGLLERIGQQSAWESLSEEYARREEFLASSRVKKVGFTITRVPR